MYILFIYIYIYIYIYMYILFIYIYIYIYIYIPINHYKYIYEYTILQILQTYIYTNHHHIRFNVCLHMLDSFSIRFASIPIFNYVLVDFPFNQNTSDYHILSFPWLSSRVTTANFEVLHLDQALSFILSR